MFPLFRNQWPVSIDRSSSLSFPLPHARLGIVFRVACADGFELPDLIYGECRDACRHDYSDRPVDDLGGFHGFVAVGVMSVAIASLLAFYIVKNCPPVF